MLPKELEVQLCSSRLEELSQRKQSWTTPGNTQVLLFHRVKVDVFKIVCRKKKKKGKHSVKEVKKEGIR